MKHILLFLSLSLFLSEATNAQLNPLSAKEMVPTAVARARSEWASDAYLQNILFAGGSQSGITLALDLTTGKANAWVYTMYSPSKDSLKYYIGVDVLILGRQIIAAPATVTIPVLPVGGHLELADPLVDSPDALQAAKDAGAASFLQSHPTAIVNVAAAVNSPEDLPSLPKGKYWFFLFGDGAEQYACWVSAETGSPAQCGTVTAVSALPPASMFHLDPVSPHPVRLSATSAVPVRYELAAHLPVRLTMHDQLGREVAVIDDGLRAPGSHGAVIPTGGFIRPGLYYLLLRTSAGSVVRKLLVME